jgi:hypothetical protein
MPDDLTRFEDELRRHRPAPAPQGLFATAERAARVRRRRRRWALASSVAALLALLASLALPRRRTPEPARTARVTRGASVGSRWSLARSAIAGDAELDLALALSARRAFRAGPYRARSATPLAQLGSTPR